MFPNPECIFEMVPLGKSPFPHLNSLLKSQTRTFASTSMHVFSYAMEMRSLRAAVTSLMEAENRRRQRMKRISQQSSVVPSADCMLSKKEVAAQLHVSERMVERYVKDGLLPTYRLGSNGSCRFKNKDIERLLIAQETTATEDHVSDFITHQLKG